MSRPCSIIKKQTKPVSELCHTAVHVTKTGTGKTAKPAVKTKTKNKQNYSIISHMKPTKLVCKTRTSF